MTYWAACYTDVAAERKARDGIEALNRGTLLPTFAKVDLFGGQRKAFERPILARYLFIALHSKDDEAWSQINHVDGVQRVLVNENKPARVSDQEIIRLTLAHAMGDCNVIQTRAANGRYQKPKRRRSRPRAGKKARSSTYVKGRDLNAISQAA